MHDSLLYSFFFSCLSPLIFVFPSCVFYFKFILPVVCFSLLPFFVLLFNIFSSIISLTVSFVSFWLICRLYFASSVFLFYASSSLLVLCNRRLRKPAGFEPPISVSDTRGRMVCVRPQNFVSRWLSRWHDFSPFSVIVVNFLQAFEK